MKIKCFKCNGKGKIRRPIDWFAGLCTLGMTILCDLDDYHTCDSCGGRGYIEDGDVV